MTSPALENRRSDGTEVGTTLRYFRVILLILRRASYFPSQWWDDRRRQRHRAARRKNSITAILSVRYVIISLHIEAASFLLKNAKLGKFSLVIEISIPSHYYRYFSVNSWYRK